MTPFDKARWLDALRSGEYPKTTKHLKDRRGFCCLGVLLAVEGYKFSETATDGHTGMPFFEPADSDMHEGNELSHVAQEAFGIPEHVHDKLISINDEQNTFDGVIEYIEENL